MLLRLLVIIFALNAFVPSAMAVACDMMNDMDMASMSHDIQDHNMSNHDMTDIATGCSMEQDHSCNSTECITSCATSFSFLSLNSPRKFVAENLINHPKDNLLSLYETFLPISTPPPLV